MLLEGVVFGLQRGEVGVLLGGGSPLQAGAAQLLVLIGLLAAQVLAVWGVTELIARGAILDDVPR